MADELEQFIDEHLQEFDTALPAEDLWLKIDTRIQTRYLHGAKSKLLSKYLYFGLSTTALVLAVIHFASPEADHVSSATSIERPKEILSKDSTAVRVVTLQKPAIPGTAGKRANREINSGLEGDGSGLKGVGPDVIDRAGVY